MTPARQLPPRICGVPGAYEQPVRYGRNESGEWSVLTYEGTRAEIYDQAYAWNSEKGAMWEVEHGFSGAKDKLTVHIPWNYANLPYLDVTTEWELFAETTEKDLLELDPSEFAFPAGSPFLLLTILEKSFIRDALDSPATWDSLVQDYDDLALTTGTTFDLTRATEVYRLMKAGFKQMRVAVPRLRRTQIVNDQYQIKASITNVGKLIKTDSLTTLYELPSDILFSLPNKAQPTSFVDGIAKRFGWYVHYPTVRQAAMIKWQVVQEWEYGLWNYSAYGEPL